MTIELNIDEFYWDKKNMRLTWSKTLSVKERVPQIVTIKGHSFTVQFNFADHDFKISGSRYRTKNDIAKNIEVYMLWNLNE